MALAGVVDVFRHRGLHQRPPKATDWNAQIEHRSLSKHPALAPKAAASPAEFMKVDSKTIVLNKHTQQVIRNPEKRTAGYLKEDAIAVQIIFVDLKDQRGLKVILPAHHFLEHSELLFIASGWSFVEEATCADRPWFSVNVDARPHVPQTDRGWLELDWRVGSVDADEVDAGSGASSNADAGVDDGIA